MIDDPFTNPPLGWRPNPEPPRESWWITALGFFGMVAFALFALAVLYELLR